MSIVKSKKKEPGVRPGSEAQGMSRGRLKPPISGRREIPDKSDIQQPAGNNKRSESFHSHLLPCLVGGVPLRERGDINMQRVDSQVKRDILRDFFLR